MPRKKIQKIRTKNKRMGMKKYLGILMTSLFLFSCVPTTKEIHMDMTPKSSIELDINKYKRVILITEGLPKINIIIPKYAYQRIIDFDSVTPTLICEENRQIMMIFFNKRSTSIQDVKHSVAIIFNMRKDGKMIPLFFQTTIQEGQRFFIYTSEGIPIETKKIVYGKRLQIVCDSQGEKK
jgi:hypothetical protein